MIKKFLKNYLSADAKNKLLQQRNLLKWNLSGRPSPPPYSFKRSVIRKITKKHSINIFIETGTYYGDTVYALKDDFTKIISIELDQDLYGKARERFKGYAHIKLYNGDSGEILGQIVPELTERAIFWLDGHYSAGVTAKGDLNTPILKELSVILKHPIKNHIILIDDARCFTGENDYPTIKQLEDFVRSINQNLNVSVSHDIIRIL